jgi:transketolase
MMKQRVIFALTHDSIGLGEDGPTHQPIEHAAILRMTPGLSVWRPCDRAETAIAWREAISNTQQPTCLLLSRQDLPEQTRDEQSIMNIQRGAYILVNTDKVPDAIIIATGSEVQLAVLAAKKLAEENYAVRVVSMPSADIFEQQALNYREQVLPPSVTARVAVEASQPDFWFKYVGLQGKIIGINRYGESAPAAEVYTALGITVENVIAALYDLRSKK